MADETPNQTANNTTTVVNPDLTVVKISNNRTVNKGNKAEFTIIVSNTGDQTLNDVFVIENIPEGLKYNSFISEDNGWYKDGDNKWIYNKSLAPNVSTNFTIIFDTEKEGNFTNVVIAGSDKTENKTANNTTTVNNPNMTVTKIAITK